MIGTTNSLTNEKRLPIGATLPAAVCERLQMLPTYFDITPIHGLSFRFQEKRGLEMAKLGSVH